MQNSNLRKQNYAWKFLKILVLLSFLIFTTSPYFINPAYAAPGDLDPSFGDGGKVLFTISPTWNGGTPANSLAIQNDGRIIIAGSTEYNFGLLRFNSNGNLDTSFGINGSVVTDFPGISEGISDIEIQQDGKIIAVGTSDVPLPNGSSRDFAVARYNSSGSLDTSFGLAGKVTTNTSTYPYGTDGAIALTTQNDGKIVVVGQAQTTDIDYQLAMVRYNADGNLDLSFGNAGKVLTTIGGHSDVANSVLVLSDGKIMVAGSSLACCGQESNLVLLRYNADGSLDYSFGNDGKVVTDISNNSSDGISELVIQPDGKFVAAGQTLIDNVFKSVIARYNIDGSFDNNFGVNGITLTNYGGVISSAESLVIQNDGKIVTGGEYQLTANSEKRFALARYDSSGNLDLGFGNSGIVITPSFHSTLNPFYLFGDLTLQPDGKIVAGGYASDNDNTSPYVETLLVRYSGDNYPPSAYAGHGQNVNEGQNVTFDGSGSTDPNGLQDIVSYEWDFGDNTIGSGQIINHTYQDNGVYASTLTVTDTQQQSDTDTTTVIVNNVSPSLGNINAPSSVGTFASFIASADFTDPGVLDTHTAIWDWGDGTTSGTVTESNGSGSVSDSHSYSTPGTYSITLTVTDNDNASDTSTTTIEAVNQLTALEPAQVWIGLKNSDSVGMRFDLMAEAYKDMDLVASGQLDNVWGGSSGFNNANLYIIPLNLTNPVDFPSGSNLGIKVYVRNACQGPTHNSGVARLWYDDEAANSQFGATIGQNSSSFYFRNNFVLSTDIGSGPKQKIDIQAGSPCRDFKLFGTWSKIIN